MFPFTPQFTSGPDVTEKHLEQIEDLTCHLEPRPAEPRTEQLNPS